MTNLFPSGITVNSRSINEQKTKVTDTAHVLVLGISRLVSYFACIKGVMTIIINYD